MVIFTVCENDLQRLSQDTSYCAQAQETKEVSDTTKQSPETHRSGAYQSQRTNEARLEGCSTQTRGKHQQQHGHRISAFRYDVWFPQMYEIFT